MSQDLRRRLYAAYVSGGQSVAPKTLDGLAPRASYLRCLAATNILPGHGARVIVWRLLSFTVQLAATAETGDGRRAIFTRHLPAIATR